MLSCSYGITNFGINLELKLIGAFLSVINKLQENYETTLNIFSEGILNTDTFAINIQQFLENTTVFINNFNQEESNKENFYTKGVYKTRFEDYSTLTLETPINNIDNILDIINNYIYYIEIYERLIFDIDLILIYPTIYDDTVDENNLLELKKQLQIKQSILRYLSSLCMKKDPLERICVDINKLSDIHFPEEWDIKQNLPNKKIIYPKSIMSLEKQTT